MSDNSIEDLKDERVPRCIYWSVDQVAEWLENIGFSIYKQCILSNFVTGRKLITLTSSTLPDVGVKDFEHIKKITKATREMLELEDVDWNRNICLPPRNSLGMYIEGKQPTGRRSDARIYERFLVDTKNARWEPPLCNVCSVFPH